MNYEDLLIRFPTARKYAPASGSYLDGDQLRLAFELLKKGQPSTVVAQTLGYSSLPAFTLAFRKRTGEAPGAWKEARGIKTPRVGKSIIRPRKTWR